VGPITRGPSASLPRTRAPHPLDGNLVRLLNPFWGKRALYYPSLSSTALTSLWSVYGGLSEPDKTCRFSTTLSGQKPTLDPEGLIRSITTPLHGGEGCIVPYSTCAFCIACHKAVAIMPPQSMVKQQQSPPTRLG
jgi:hypothetical protein